MNARYQAPPLTMHCAQVAAYRPKSRGWQALALTIAAHVALGSALLVGLKAVQSVVQPLPVLYMSMPQAAPVAPPEAANKLPPLPHSFKSFAPSVAQSTISMQISAPEAADTPSSSTHVAASASSSLTPPSPAPLTEARFDADHLSNPPPTYPALSIRRQESGQVLLLVKVSSSGTPLSIELHKSSGFPRLDKAALDVVRLWRFVPAKRGSEPVEGLVIVPLDFIWKDASSA